MCVRWLGSFYYTTQGNLAGKVITTIIIVEDFSRGYNLAIYGLTANLNVHQYPIIINYTRSASPPCACTQGFMTLYYLFTIKPYIALYRYTFWRKVGLYYIGDPTFKLFLKKLNIIITIGNTLLSTMNVND